MKENVMNNEQKNYKLIKITSPTIQIHRYLENNATSYHLYDCGNLIFMPNNIN